MESTQKHRMSILTGTIMAISLRPPISSRLRLRASQPSAGCARSTSASGVLRSTATATPSTKRASGASVVRSAHAVESLDQTRSHPVFGQRTAQLPGELTTADPGLIHFERDGWVVLEGMCTRWTGPPAYVRIPDRRIQHGRVWLHAGDVRRR
jgi:hypothetical protein